MQFALRKQHGHAAILFAITIPALFGIFVLATDGAFAIQSKARIDDATEVAALALTARDAPNKDSGGNGSGSTANQKIAKDYISAYMGNRSDIKNLKIYRKDCEQIPECKAGLKQGGQRYIQFSVSADYDHSTFFTSKLSDGYKEGKIKVSSAAISQKYEGDAVDIIYAADFSGSMKQTWSGGNRKVNDLKDIIQEVNAKLEDVNKKSKGAQKNTVGIVAFTSHTRSKIHGKNRNCTMTQLVRSKRKIDYDASVHQVMIEKGQSFCHSSSWNKREVELTDKFSSFKQQLNGYQAGGWTASYEGIIRAAQLLKSGENARRLIIVLSDGEDSLSRSNKVYYKNYHAALVRRGYCKKIREALSVGTTKDGKPIKAKIAAIGFDYDAKKNKALKDCVGEENLFKAENKAEIKSKILDLISEEIGHLK
ncbi:pilus assembly protein [Vibrio nigripulchritudo]|uniref:pilus assembly protein n=1 Tax=Vibrio nigripulchritudo TaxID=28173 RepID=UPI00249014EF|nr:pilus assembly protein [Vibrio nigripulchritudo]BDU39734.1 hypothetical protein TUMSATVNIG2_42030 [Vibrio nigripulchritudo]BDU45457.1 hypothetical protein TUMSATVNIG3_42550 [Vibrio nigripulchritudo]